MRLKEAVLEVLRSGGKPLGAYEILARLEARRGKLAPTSVYRALNALVAERLAHRVESMNAFIGCQSARCHERRPDGMVLSICDACGAVDEQFDDAVIRDLGALARRSGFRASRHVIEIHGRCGACDAGLAS